jgi:hypothetical protein
MSLSQNEAGSKLCSKPGETAEKIRRKRPFDESQNRTQSVEKLLTELTRESMSFKIQKNAIEVKISKNGGREKIQGIKEEV